MMGTIEIEQTKSRETDMNRINDPTCAERLYANGNYDAPGHS